MTANPQPANATVEDAQHLQCLRRLWVLRGVHFELRDGEVHALCSESGTGKSTLIKTFSGAVPRTSSATLMISSELPEILRMSSRILVAREDKITSWTSDASQISEGEIPGHASR